LKVAFDKFDEDQDGLLHKFEVKECFEHLGRSEDEIKQQKVEAFISATPGPGKDDKSNNGGVQFTDFVVCYCDFFAGSDPNVRLGDVDGAGPIDINKRVKYLKKSGHVTLLPKKEGEEDEEQVRRNKAPYSFFLFQKI
jgi:Ca2+-binding EF-hand superfamily protein